MTEDLMTQVYKYLNLPAQEKVLGLTKIIDQSGFHKDMQALFLQIVNSIFSTQFNNGWDLRQLTSEMNKYDYESLINFLEPRGPMFRLCYKLLLSDPQVKFNLPLNMLPLDLQITLERCRCPQFYADMLTMDSQSLNVVALALNPFDYYIFNFALYLINSNQHKGSWENWNSVYFALACDYLMHFLPSDPNMPVLPHIPYYTGKVPVIPPLQSSNRPLYSPSLLILPDLSGISNQHSSPQSQSRNEIWRSESVLQIFVDVWMSVEQFNNRNIDVYQRSLPVLNSSPERVRLVRVLVKHVHSFSAKYHSDPVIRSLSLRKYARQIMCARAYNYIKQLILTWPLDASFRLVLELWLSLIQPWRYNDNSITQDRFPSRNAYQDDANSGTLDSSFTQFIAENFPTYTCILQLVLPRFLRLDLSTYKNAVMLFRLGKVFSQPHLAPILQNLEKSITDNVSGLQSPDTSSSNLNLEQSYTYNGITLHKWVTIAKQAISELNFSTTFEYQPMWSENNKQYTLEFVKRILMAKHVADRNLEEYSKKYNEQHTGLWTSIKKWLMIANTQEDDLLLEEFKRVPIYLNNCKNYYTYLFGLSDNSVLATDTDMVDSTLEHSSFANSNNFTLNITQKLRNKHPSVHYMGDPDLMPISTFENTILVRIMYQLSTRLNELYGEQFSRMYSRNDILGYVSREVLQKPCTIHTYMKDANNHKSIVNQELPARVSLRRLGSHMCMAWLAFCYIVFRSSSEGGLFYFMFLIVSFWTLIVLSRAFLKILGMMKE